MPSQTGRPAVLTIAGSDSGAGAGVQADLKTFAALGVYGTCVLTAVTAQNTLGVTAVHELPPEIVAAQIDAVAADIPPDAVHALRHRLLPLATVITPNLPEAEALLGRRLETGDDVRRAAKEIVALGAGAAVIKGGHLPADRQAAPGDVAVDVLFDGRQFREYVAPRIVTASTHGTGCTFASAIAAYLARGEALPEAVGRAKEYITEALRHAYPIGSGHGPVHHFWHWWKD